VREGKRAGEKEGPWSTRGGVFKFHECMNSIERERESDRKRARERESERERERERERESSSSTRGGFFKFRA